MTKVDLVVYNVRSAHNVGSLLRTADGLGINQVWLCGYTPYPASPDDERLPHEAKKITEQIHKTALGAEDSIKWQRLSRLEDCFEMLKQRGYHLAALEQTKSAQQLKDFRPPAKLALIVGNEVAGLDKAILNIVDSHLIIPMHGQKESFNVSVAAAIALYHLINL